MLFTVPYLLAGLAVLAVVLFVMALSTFFFVRFLNSSYKSSGTYQEALLLMELMYLRGNLINSGQHLATLSITTQQTLYNNVVSNALTIFVFFLVSLVMFLVLVLQPTLATGYAIVSQCGVAQLRDFVLLPLLNVATFLLDIYIPLWNTVWRMWAFFTWLNIVVLASCTDFNNVTHIFMELGHVASAYVQGLTELLLGGDIVNERWDVAPVLYHMGQALIQVIPALQCYCGMLNFLWVPVFRAASFISLATAADCAWNVPIRFLQAFIRPIAGQGFTTTPWANEFECAVHSAGDLAQDIVLQVFEIFMGVIYQYAAPCSQFSSDPAVCRAYGYCGFDYVTNECRAANPCDPLGTRDMCNLVDGCAWSANMNPTTHEIIFSCAASVLNQVPVFGDASCAGYTTPTRCAAHSNVCLWDGRVSPAACKPVPAVCNKSNTRLECETLSNFCSGKFSMPDPTHCADTSNNICRRTSSSTCTSWRSTCTNTRCFAEQLCAYDTTANQCVPRDVLTGQRMVQSFDAAGANATLNFTRPVASMFYAPNGSRLEGADAPMHADFVIPPPGSDAGDLAAQFGANAVLAILQLQWAHGMYTEIFMLVFRALVQVIEVITNAQTTFAQYKGLETLRIGFIYDHWRCAWRSWTQLGLIIDRDLPCVLEGVVNGTVDVYQSVFELFALFFFFAIHQPTGMPSEVNLWSPFDFLASYYNDTRVAFSPLIFLDNVPFQWSRHPRDPNLFLKCNRTGRVANVDYDYLNNPYQAWFDVRRPLPERVDSPCLSINPTNEDSFYEIEIENNWDTVLACRSRFTCARYHWVDDVAVLSIIGRVLHRVDVFPGLDRSIRNREEIRRTSSCVNLFLGNGQPNTDTYYPWACAMQHVINVMGELSNIMLMIIFSIVDMLRFTQDPIYRKSPLEIPLDRYFEEWTAAALCISNIIRMGQSPGPFGLCTEQTSDGTFMTSSTFICCLADLVQRILDGVYIHTIHEFSLFVRDLLGIQFVVGMIYLPNLAIIIDDMSSTIAGLACVISSIIPKEFICPMKFADGCTVGFNGDNGIPCAGNPNAYGERFLNCDVGNACFAGLLTSIFTAPLVTLVILDNFYITIRGIVSVRCDSFNTANKCMENGCDWAGNNTMGQCSSPPFNVGAVSSFITFIEGIFESLFNTYLLIIYRFTLFIDCVSCGARVATHRAMDPDYLQTCNRGKPFSACGQCGTSDTGESTPIFNFVHDVLKPMVDILGYFVAFVVNITILVIVLFIALISGNIDSIDTVITTVGEHLRDIMNSMLMNVSYLFLAKMGLLDFVNSVIDFFNEVYYGFCSAFNSFIWVIANICCLSDIPTNYFRIPDGCAGYCHDLVGALITPCERGTIDPIKVVPGPDATPPPNCADVESPIECQYLPTCFWTQSACIAATACQQAGSSRKKCVEAGIAVGNMNTCFFQTSATPTQNHVGFLAQQCVDRVPRILATRIYPFPKTTAIDPVPIAFPGCGALLNYAACMGDNARSWAGVCYWTRSNTCVSAAPLCHSHASSTDCARMTNLCPTTSDPDVCGATGSAQDYRGLCAIYNGACVSTAFKLASQGSINAQYYFQCKWVAFHVTAGSFIDAQCVSHAEWADMQRSATYDMSAAARLYRDFYKKRGADDDNTTITTTMEEEKEGWAWTEGDTPLPPLPPGQQPSEPIVPHTQRRFVDYLKRQVIDTGMPWAADDACGFLTALDEETLGTLVTGATASGAEFDGMARILFCLGRILSNTSSDNRYAPPYAPARASAGTNFPGYRAVSNLLVAGTCEVLFQEYYGLDKMFTWEDLRPLERVELADCVRSQIMGVYMRIATNYTWLPTDIVSNWLSKWMLIPQLARNMRLYYLYKADRSLDAAVVLAPSYATSYRAQGLNMDYLIGINDTETLHKRLASMTLLDYYTLNGLSERDALMGEDMGRLFGDFGATLTNTLTSSLSRLSYTPGNFTFADLMTNSTSQSMSRLLTSTLLGATAAAAKAFNNTANLASSAPALMKRALPAAVNTGRAIVAGMGLFSSWWAAPHSTQTPLRPTPPPLSMPVTVNAAAFQATPMGISRAGGLVGSMPTRASATLKAFTAAIWRDTRAAERRATLAMLFEQVTFTLKYQLLAHTTPDPTAYRMEMLRTASPATVASLRAYASASDPVHSNKTFEGMDTILGPLPCLTNMGNLGTTYLCENCIYLDQLLGRIILLGRYLYDYYSGINTALWYTYPRAYETFVSYQAYLTTSTATVCVGDSCQLPLRFPSNVHSNMRYVGDPKPDKLRLYDYGDLLDEFFAALVIVGTDPNSLLLVETLRSVASTVYSTAASYMWTAGLDTAHVVGVLSDAHHATLTTRFVNGTLPGSSNSTMEGAATRPVGELMGLLVQRVFNQFLFCDFPLSGADQLTGHTADDELSGNQKRFALGEVIAAGVLVSCLVLPLLVMVVPSTALVVVVLVVVPIMLMLMHVTVLSFIYNWSFNCAPAMPVPLAGDIRHFIGYVLLPKCTWLLSGVYNELYTGDTCYSCEAARALTAPYCISDLGFKSIAHNLAFMSVANYPDLPQRLTDMGLGSLVRLMNETGLFDQFRANYDPADDISFSQHQACNWIWTLVPHAILSAFGAFLAFQGFPLIVLAYQIMAYLVQNLLALLFFASGVVSYASYESSYSAFVAAYGKTPEQHAFDGPMGGGMGGAAPTPGPPAGTPPMQTLAETTRQALSESALGVATQGLRRRFGRKPTDAEEDEGTTGSNMEAGDTATSMQLQHIAIRNGLINEH